MRFIIVGPGAIGCLFAARLHAHGCEVALLDHNAERAAQLHAGGLTIEDAEGSHVLHVPILSTALPSGADIILLCVKAYDTDSALQTAAPWIGPTTAVVSLQNGIGNAEKIAARVGPGRTICAVTALGALQTGIGAVRETGQGPTAIAPFSRMATDQAQALAGALRNAGFDTSLSPTPGPILWEKLVLNAGVNATTALWKVRNGELPGHPQAWRTACAAACEAANVADALGHSLPYGDVAQRLREVCAATRDNRSSMLRDMEAGRPTEVDYINGAVAREGKRLGVPTPINEDLTARIHALSPPRGTTSD